MEPVDKVAVILVCLCVLAVATSVGLVWVALNESKTATAPQASFGSQSHFVKDIDGRAIAGRSSGTGFSIEWKSELVPTGADPREVIQCTLERLKHLESTREGSNEYAKAIWNLDQASEELKSHERIEPPRGAGFIKPSSSK